MNIQEGISKVVSNQDLQKQEISSVMFEILEGKATDAQIGAFLIACLLYTSPSPRDLDLSRMPSSA